MKRELDLPNGCLAYHLNALEKQSYIQSKRDGMYRRFFPVEMKVGKLSTELSLSKSQRIIYKIIKKTPGLSQKEIGNKISLSISTVNYHINSMTDSGLIRLERNGNTTKCYPEELMF